MDRISEDYVSFEIAKLLKEKGFNEYCRAYYKNYHIGLPEIYNSPQLIDNQSLFELGLGISAPTLQMVMKWLRKVHNLHIKINVESFDGRHPVYEALYDEIINIRTNNFIDYGDTYEQACEVAIKYCLENLI